MIDADIFLGDDALPFLSFMGRAAAAYALLATLLVVVPATAQNNAPDTPEMNSAQPLPGMVMGNANAPLTIDEYSSLSCPHCARFHAETLPQIEKAYVDTGKAKLIIHDFPLNSPALTAAKLAHCAPPAMYFTLMDILFKSQNVWLRADNDKPLMQMGKLAGVSEDQYKACQADKDLENGILAEQLQAQNKFKVTSTPTFIINGGAAKIEGESNFAEFSETLDGLLPKK